MFQALCPFAISASLPTSTQPFISCPSPKSMETTQSVCLCMCVCVCGALRGTIINKDHT